MSPLRLEAGGRELALHHFKDGRGACFIFESVLEAQDSDCFGFHALILVVGG